LHRDKDPTSPGGDSQKFSRSISVICNLNQQWNPAWGGDFILWAGDSGDLQEHTRIPISPGQLVIVENCYHSIAPIIEYDQSRISFILHVLEYQ
jgi:Rps23 Pro-64 3,4-dihydroxylase Tpa1-like proline 4-hydroxylase